MRKLGIGAALCALTFVGVQAAGVWESKPFTEWSDKETQAILADSPWAGKGSLTKANTGGSFGPVPDWKVTVTWRTAIPIRQALVRQQIGQGGKPSADQQADLASNEPNYIIAIDGLPSMYAGMLQAIVPQTSLERDGKAPLPPVRVAAHVIEKNGNIVPAPAPQAGGGAARGGRGGFGAFPPKDDGSTATLMFGFPKTDPITAADKEVDFSTTIGPYHLKRKFRVKDMIVNGEPAL